MNNWRRIAWLLLLLSPMARGQKTDADWVPTFSDEFDGGELDLSRWSPHDPWGTVRDRELQGWSNDSVAIGDGQLHLVARRTTESKPVRYDGKDREYASGTVTTFGTYAQTYGRFEIRCRVPAGKGLRAGFSLMPIPLGTLPRIEIFEVPGSAPATIGFANQWGDEQTERTFGNSFPGPDFSTGFHVVAIEWDEEEIVWFVDGKEKFRSVDGVPHQPMYLMLRLAVGGGEGNARMRLPDESTVMPASFDIDYVRVYKRK